MKLAIAYKNFAANPGVSHIGLGVSALNNAKVLIRHGLDVHVWAINTVDQLISYLNGRHGQDVTHVIISAAWLSTCEIGKLLIQFPHVEFAVNIHSNVGFLQADARGVDLLRDYVNLQREMLNFRVSGNSRKFVDWLNEVYAIEGAYLPNLYDLDKACKTNKPLYNGGVMRIGAFGATRPLKNLMTAAGAAMAIQTQMRCEVEFFINAGRTEGGGNTIVKAVCALLARQPGIKLEFVAWRPWPEFRAFIRRMHLLLQVSYTESFNMVTADGVAEGVPSVVSDAIDWSPRSWQVSMDDVLSVATAGRRLITDPHAAVEGVEALEAHNREGFHSWVDFLEEAPQRYRSGVFAAA